MMRSQNTFSKYVGGWYAHENYQQGNTVHIVIVIQLAQQYTTYYLREATFSFKDGNEIHITC